MISMNKKYKTKDNREVRVLCTDRDCPDFPVVALINNVYIEWYTSEGKRNTEGDSKYDLIEVKPKVKYLKSIKQILEEFPYSRFDLGGELTIIGGAKKLRINNHMFYHFGKPLEEADNSWTYLPEWIEEIDA